MTLLGAGKDVRPMYTRTSIALLHVLFSRGVVDDYVCQIEECVAIVAKCKELFRSTKCLKSILSDFPLQWFDFYIQGIVNSEVNMPHKREMRRASSLPQEAFNFSLSSLDSQQPNGQPLPSQRMCL